MGFPVLIIPYLSKPFEVYCDASYMNLGCVLILEKESCFLCLSTSKGA